MMISHVRRYHRQFQGSGRVWQRRFKAFPVQADDHYLTEKKYVNEENRGQACFN